MTPVFLGTLIPLLFLMGLLKNEHRVLVGYFAWGLVAFMAALAVNTRVVEWGWIAREELSIHVAPAVEELLKVLPLCAFILRRRATKRYLIVYYAMASGIGFSIIENYLYLSQLGGTDGTGMYMVLRSISTALMHGMATAVVGMGLSFIQEFHVFVLPIAFGLLSAAITGHSLYNLTVSSAPYHGIAVVIPLALYCLSLPVIGTLYRREHG